MSFDALAPHYRWLEFTLAGQKLQRCRLAFLDRVTAAQNILILGEGNGRFLKELIGRVSNAQITCVDASAPMLSLARRRLERFGLHSKNIQFVHADALRWEPPPRLFDLLVTHFFLDCFRPEQIDLLIGKFSLVAAAQPLWLLADFQIPACGWKGMRARAIHRLMYAFFRIATRLPARTLTPPDHFLESHGFVLRQRRVTELGLLHSDWWSRGGSNP